MARLRSTRPTGPRHRIAIIDDDVELAASMRSLLAREGHEVHVATHPRDGVELIRARRPQLVLLDYLMPEMTGADVVRAVRAFDPMVQILLVTGYAEEQPGRRLLAELDIQGYHDKADGPDRLMVLVDAALKYYRSIQSIERQKARLAKVVDAGPEISKLQPAAALFRTALSSLVSLFDGPGDALVATSNSGLFLMEDAEEGVSVRAGMGRYAELSSLTELPEPTVRAVRAALDLDHPEPLDGELIAVPLRTRDGDRGCIVVSAPAVLPECEELCQIYARMVVQALENLVLYERATHDPLCRTWNRSAGLRRLTESLKLAQRDRHDTSVILVDIDHFKHVNDRWGHAAGDLALTAVAQAMVGVARETDVVSRYGGEEFLIVLPSTGAAAAAVLAERIRARIESLEVRFEGALIPLTASFGVASAQPTEWNIAHADELVRTADQAMYAAKNGGRNQVVSATPAPTPAP